MVCLNCKHEHEEHYCPNCGEKSQIEKITFGSMLKSLLSNIINMDRGFLSNLKNLTVHTSEIMNSYVKGRRKGILNPLSYLILSTTIYLLVDSLLPREAIEARDQSNTSKVYLIGYEAGKFIKEYLKYFWIVSIVFLSIPSRVIFKRYNLAEHLAISSFIIAQATLFGLFGELIFRWGLLFNPLVYTAIVIMLFRVYSPWYGRDQTIVYAFTSTLLFFILLITCILFIGYIRSL